MMKSLGLAVALSGLRRSVMRLVNATRGALGGGEQQRLADLIPNPTLNLMIVATWTTPEGKVKRMGHRVWPHRGVRRQLFANLFYLEFLDLANALGDQVKQRKLIRGLDTHTRRMATKLGALVPRSKAPSPVRYECALGAELHPLVPRHRLGSITPEDRSSFVLNRRIHVQTGAEIPPAIADRLRATDRMSQRRPIVWVEDPGTEIVMPYWPSEEVFLTVSALIEGAMKPEDVSPPHADALAHAWVLVRPGWEEERKAEWSAHLAEIAKSLESDGYAVVPNVFNPVALGAVRTYVDTLAAGGYMHAGDKLVAMRDWAHNDPLCYFIHPQLGRLLNRCLRDACRPSFSYLNNYHSRAVLDRHVDRDQCVWNMSVALDGSAGLERDTAWPIFLEVRGETRRVPLAAGECVIYSGTTIPHWRDALPDGQYARVCALHYVPMGFQGSLS